MRGRGLERGSSPLPSKKIFLKTIILIDSVPAAGSRTGIIYCRDRAPVYINMTRGPPAPRTGGPADSRTGTETPARNRPVKLEIAKNIF